MTTTANRQNRLWVWSLLGAGIATVLVGAVLLFGLRSTETPERATSPVPAAAVAEPLPTPPLRGPAGDGPRVAVGDKIIIGTSACTAGPLATNAAGKRLIVTAGHCATAAGIGASTYNANGTTIGQIVYQRYVRNAFDKLDIAIIELAPNVSVAALPFKQASDAQPTQDAVCQDGAFGRRTCAPVLGFEVQPQRGAPNSVMTTSLDTKHGDSGVAVSLQDRPETLVAMTVSFTEFWNAPSMTYSLPWKDLQAFVQQQAGGLGEGFQLWTTAS